MIFHLNHHHFSPVQIGWVVSFKRVHILSWHSFVIFSIPAALSVRHGLGRLWVGSGLSRVWVEFRSGWVWVGVSTFETHLDTFDHYWVRLRSFLGQVWETFCLVTTLAAPQHGGWCCCCCCWQWAQMWLWVNIRQFSLPDEQTHFLILTLLFNYVQKGAIFSAFLWESERKEIISKNHFSFALDAKLLLFFRCPQKRANILKGI